MAVILSVILSVYVYSKQDTSTTNRGNVLSVQTEKTVEKVSIHVVDSSNSKYISGLSESVSVVLEGPRNVLAQLSASNLYVSTEDVAKHGNGPAHIKLELKGLPTSVKATIIPSEQAVTLDTKVSKQFNVTPIVENVVVAEGYEMGNVTVSPEKVTLTGSQEAIANVHSVTANIVSATLQTETLTQNLVPVIVKDSKGNILDVNVDNTVTITVPIYRRGKTVPVIVSLAGQKEGYTYTVTNQSVKTLTILGTNEQLNQTTNITATVNVSDVTSTQTLEATVLVPQEITISNPQPVNVTVTVTKQ